MSSLFPGLEVAHELARNPAPLVSLLHEAPAEVSAALGRLHAHGAIALDRWKGLVRPRHVPSIPFVNV
jgi:hypothetical protein